MGPCGQIVFGSAFAVEFLRAVHGFRRGRCCWNDDLVLERQSKIRWLCWRVVGLCLCLTDDQVVELG